jgi:hypothetical protein
MSGFLLAATVKQKVSRNTAVQHWGYRLCQLLKTFLIQMKIKTNLCHSQKVNDAPNTRFKYASYNLLFCIYHSVLARN